MSTEKVVTANGDVLSKYVHFKGDANGGAILNERRFEGCLFKILPELENFIRVGIVTKRPVSISILREKDVLNYVNMFNHGIG